MWCRNLVGSRSAKAGTEKADATDLREAQQQLGHESLKTTEIHVPARAGAKVTPTKRSTELRNGPALAKRRGPGETAGSRMDIGSPTWARTRDLRINSPITNEIRPSGQRDRVNAS